MGINNLSLSPEIIAALYPESLVVEKTPESPKKAAKSLTSDSGPASPVYSFLGKNLRSICFLVEHPDQEFISPAQLSFIGKILAACKCTQDDIAIINLAHQEVRLPELKSRLRTEKLFLWGVSPARIGIQQQPLPELEISSVEDILIVPVFNPEKMNMEIPEGVEMKQRLWASLKKLFNL